MSLTKSLQIDFAVLCQEVQTKIDLECSNSHLIPLDEIFISKKQFRDLFYSTGENFGLNKLFALKTENKPFISFSQDHRTEKGNRFYLMDRIIRNLEYDLNVTRNCFTPETRVGLAKELSGIDSLCDIECCSVLTSLTWTNLETILQDHSKMNENAAIVPYLCLSVIFRTPTEGTKDSVIRFTYKVVE
jgi:hypothetical protein